MDHRFANSVHKTFEGYVVSQQARRIGRPSGYNRDIQPILRDTWILQRRPRTRRGASKDLPIFQKTRRGAEKSRIKLCRMYRRVPYNTLYGLTVHSRNVAKLESFLRGSRMYGLCKLGLPRLADYGTVGSKLARGSVDLITFRTTTCRTICFHGNELSHVRRMKKLTQFSQSQLDKHVQHSYIKD